MLSQYIALRVRPFPRFPPPEQKGCGPSTRMSPLRNAAASHFFTPCHPKASRKNGVMVE